MHQKTLTGTYIEDFPIHLPFDETIHKLANPDGSVFQEKVSSLKGSFLGTPATNGLIFAHFFDAPVNLPNNLPNSYFWCSNIPTAATTFEILSVSEAETLEIGFIYFDTTNFATVSFNEDTLIPAGNRLLIRASGASNDIGNLTWTLDCYSVGVLITTPEQYFNFDEITGAITGFDLNGGTDIVIPSHINGIEVTEIADFAFAPPGAENEPTTGIQLTGETTPLDSPDKSGITLSLPPGLKKIGMGAFYKAGLELLNIETPSSLESVGENAFKQNLLKSLNLPDSINEIGAGAFSNNVLGASGQKGIWGFFSSLSNLVTLPRFLTSIKKDTFKNNNLEISKLILSDTITSLEDGAFAHNYPKQNAKESSYGFAGSLGSKSSSITYPNISNKYSLISSLPPELFLTKDTNETTKHFSVDGKDITAGYHSAAILTFEKKEVIIPGTVVSVADNAFENCWITHLTLKPGVKTLGINAFANNPLVELNIPGTVTNIGSAVFKNSEISYDYLDPLYSNPLQKKATLFPNILQKLTLENGVKTIATEAFKDHMITDLVIPPSATVIYTSAFEDNKITNLVVQSEATTFYIYHSAFKNNQIENLILSDNTSYIGPYAFFNNKISTVEIPPSLSNIQPYVFANNSIQAVFMTDGTTDIENNAFADNLITSLVLPDTVTSVGEQAFLNNKITDVVFSENIVEIADEAFMNNLLTTVDLPNINNIGDRAFASNKITTVTVPSNLTQISQGLFKDNNIRNLELHDNITKISASAFENNLIEDVIFPNNLITLGERAFKNNPISSLGYNNQSVGAAAIKPVVVSQDPLFDGTFGQNDSFFREKFLDFYQKYDPNFDTYNWRYPIVYRYDASEWKMRVMLSELPIQAPTTDEIPQTDIHLSNNNDEYTGTISWKNPTNRFLPETIYEATVNLIPAENRTLSGIPNNYFLANNAISTINAENSGIIDIVYPATAPLTKTTISIPEFSFVLPREGNPLATRASGNAHCAVVGYWENPEATGYTCVKGHAYRINCVVTPKEGYTLLYVPESFFSHTQAIDGALYGTYNLTVIQGNLEHLGTFILEYTYTGS